MSLFLNSILTLFLILLVARILKRHARILQRYYIPSSLVAGTMGLFLGPQVTGAVPAEVTQLWSHMPKYLITIVFAGLFLGKHIPKPGKIWRMAGPMISFGMTLAWGQYVLGILLAMFILTPFFGAHPLVGSLIEISFEGGHGTVAGLAPTFEELGWSEGTDIAFGIATVSIIAAIASGIFLINLNNRRNKVVMDAVAAHRQKSGLIRSGYNLAALSAKLEKHPEKLLIHVAVFALAVGIGWLLLQGFIHAEEALLGGVTDLRFFEYLPLFPLAMIGGLLIQFALRKAGRSTMLDRKVVHSFSGVALDLLIASAIATVSLQVIGDNLAIFLILSIAGIVWILACFLLLAPRMFTTHWFENGITNTGQSMGMTATGLLMNKLADPQNHAKAQESFAYKQLMFEPFMGGGLVTAVSAVVIYQFGSVIALTISSVAFLFWLGLGLWLPRTYAR